MRCDRYGMQLVSDRLVLREVNAHDVTQIHAYASDPEVCRYSPWGPNSVTDTESFVAACLQEQRALPRTAYTLAITMTGVLIGAVTVVAGDDDEAEIGYVLNREYWGLGIATEAATITLKWALSELGAQRVFATCRPGNFASIRVLEKLGLVREAHLIDHMWMRDHWEDSLRFALPDHR